MSIGKYWKFTAIGKPYHLKKLSPAQRSAASSKAWLKRQKGGSEGPPSPDRRHSIPDSDVPTGATPEQHAGVQAGLSVMAPDEKQQFEDGYVAARQEGFEGTKGDFLIDQLALYEHPLNEDGTESIVESDPRFKTFFYAPTLEAFKSSPAWTLVQKRISEQPDSATWTQQPPSPDPSRPRGMTPIAIPRDREQIRRV